MVPNLDRFCFPWFYFLWFYFVGGKGARVRACIGQFNPLTQSITIVFDTRAIQRLSGMGASIELARGQLVPVGPLMYLLLRHIEPVEIEAALVEAKFIGQLEAD